MGRRGGVTIQSNPISPRPVGLTFGSPRGLVEIETHLKGTHKISHALKPRADAVI